MFAVAEEPPPLPALRGHGHMTSSHFDCGVLREIHYYIWASWLYLSLHASELLILFLRGPVIDKALGSGYLS